MPALIISSHQKMQFSGNCLFLWYFSLAPYLLAKALYFFFCIPPLLSVQKLKVSMCLEHFIRSFLTVYCMIYMYSKVLMLCLSETGQPKTPLDRSFLTNELNIQEDSDTARL